MWVPDFCDKKISGSSLIYTTKSDLLQANMIDHHNSSSMIHKNNLKQTISESRLSWRARYILGTYCHLHISCLYNTHKQTLVWFENYVKIIWVMPFYLKKQHLSLFLTPFSSSFVLKIIMKVINFNFFSLKVEI